MKTPPKSSAPATRHETKDRAALESLLAPDFTFTSRSTTASAANLLRPLLAKQPAPQRSKSKSSLPRATKSSRNNRAFPAGGRATFRNTEVLSPCATAQITHVGCLFGSETGAAAAEEEIPVSSRHGLRRFGKRTSKAFSPFRRRAGALFPRAPLLPPCHCARTWKDGSPPGAATSATKSGRLEVTPPPTCVCSQPQPHDRSQGRRHT